jgi:hypothetical protein
VARYLRDERIRNLSISAESLSQLAAVFADRASVANADVPQEETAQIAFWHYVIRFDNKGYRVFSLPDLLKHFHLANKVERVVFTLENIVSVQTNRNSGPYIELRLDTGDPNLCMITVTADDQDWVDASMSAVRDVLLKCKNRNGWVRTTWTAFVVQLLGLITGFILSLWTAAKIAPMLTVENAFILTFFFVLLIYSNMWLVLNAGIHWLLNKAFPNVIFYRTDKERFHWLLQALVEAIFVAVVLFALSHAYTVLSQIVSGFIRKDG